MCSSLQDACVCSRLELPLLRTALPHSLKQDIEQQHATLKLQALVLLVP